MSDGGFESAREDLPQGELSGEGDGYRKAGVGDRYKGGARGSRVRGQFKKKVCRFCTQNLSVNYKNPDSLRRFVTERGKILPRRITGTCASHQRALAREIKRSRVLALLPYVKR